MSDLSRLRGALDWGSLAPLRLRSRSVAEGIYTGAHRSLRRGAGVEFGGHRSYVPGDDLRWLDRHALMRHGRLVVREFETETDRALCLVLDASASMAFRSQLGAGAKLAFSALLAAALARIALASGDPVSLDWLGGERVRPLPRMGGREAFERIVGTLESAEPGGDLRFDDAAAERGFAPVARNARRGSVVVLFSDFIDLPGTTLNSFAALASRGRILVAVRVLDPEEASFPFQGPVLLRASEGGHRVETDAPAVRQAYLERLAAVASTWRERLLVHGGRYLESTTGDDPAAVVRSIVAAVGGGP